MAVIEWDFVRAFQRELIVSGAILLVLLGVRWVLVHRFLRREDLPYEVRRRFIVDVRNVTLLLFVVAMVLIWARELQTMAISLFAIAAAMVIATKELILCISGAFVRGHIFAVGDRIEVAGQRGDVIDKTTLTTRLMEIGPGQEGHQYTGRMLVVPNSKFLSDPVVNETGLGDYLTHVIVVPMKLEDDWRSARQMLLEAGRNAVAPFQAKAAEYFKQIETARNHYVPDAEPRVSVSMPEPTRINLQLRVPIPKGRKQRIQQLVLNQFLDQFQAAQEAKAKAEASARATSIPSSNGTTMPEPAPTAPSSVPASAPLQ